MIFIYGSLNAKHWWLQFKNPEKNRLKNRFIMNNWFKLLIINIVGKSNQENRKLGRDYKFSYEKTHLSNAAILTHIKQKHLDVLNNAHPLILLIQYAIDKNNKEWLIEETPVCWWAAWIHSYGNTFRTTEITTKLHRGYKIALTESKFFGLSEKFKMIYNIIFKYLKIKIIEKSIHLNFFYSCYDWRSEWQSSSFWSYSMV